MLSSLTERWASGSRSPLPAVGPPASVVTSGLGIWPVAQSLNSKLNQGSPLLVSWKVMRTAWTGTRRREVDPRGVPASSPKLHLPWCSPSWQISSSCSDARGEAHPLGQHTRATQEQGCSGSFLCAQGVAQGPAPSWYSVKLHGQVKP